MKTSIGEKRSARLLSAQPKKAQSSMESEVSQDANVTIRKINFLVIFQHIPLTRKLDRKQT